MGFVGPAIYGGCPVRAVRFVGADLCVRPGGVARKICRGAHAVRGARAVRGAHSGAPLRAGRTHRAHTQVRPYVGADTRGAHAGAPLRRGGHTGRTRRCAPTSGQTHRSAPTVGEVVQWFKTMSTNDYIRGVKEKGWPGFALKLWQRNYYEHIIRDDNDLNRLREYIFLNPAKWSEDPENPVNIGSE